MDEILLHEVAVVTDPHFDASYTEVLDLRSAEKLDLFRSDMEAIVGYESSHELYAGSRKVAFVAPADLEFGLGRMYEMMEHESLMETRVFRELDAACEWAGLSVSDFDGD
jgi:hypothetical protein